jgi:hypothetical protein
VSREELHAGMPAVADEYYLTALRRLKTLKHDVRIQEQRTLAIREQARREGVTDAHLRDLERAVTEGTG